MGAKYEVLSRGQWDHNGTLRNVIITSPGLLTTDRELSGARKAARRALKGSRSSRHTGTYIRGNRRLFYFDVSRLERLS